jgi:hypothetical protein
MVSGRLYKGVEPINRSFSESFQETVKYMIPQIVDTLKDPELCVRLSAAGTLKVLAQHGK